MTRGQVGLLFALALATGLTWGVTGFRASFGLNWLALLLAFLSLGSALGAGCLYLFGRPDLTWPGILGVAANVLALPAGSFAGNAWEDYDFRTRRLPLYEGIVERVRSGEIVVAPGEQAMIPLDQEVADIASTVIARRDSAGEITVQFCWGGGGPPAFHDSYVYRSSGTWSFDAVYSDWYSRIDEHWFRCGDS